MYNSGESGTRSVLNQHVSSLFLPSTLTHTCTHVLGRREFYVVASPYESGGHMLQSCSFLAFHTIDNNPQGCSAGGSASDFGSEGPEFESRWCHRSQPSNCPNRPCQRMTSPLPRFGLEESKPMGETVVLTPLVPRTNPVVHSLGPHFGLKG